MRPTTIRGADKKTGVRVEGAPIFTGEGPEWTRSEISEAQFRMSCLQTQLRCYGRAQRRDSGYKGEKGC